MSPLLFAVCTDLLLEIISNIDVGCHMCWGFIGAIDYDADITLLSESILRIVTLIKAMWNYYVTKFGIMSSKSKLLHFVDREFATQIKK